MLTDNGSKSIVGQSRLDLRFYTAIKLIAQQPLDVIRPLYTVSHRKCKQGVPQVLTHRLIVGL